MIDAAAETFCFIAIAESGKSKAVFQRNGLLDGLSAELIGANRAGFGISVAVNETDGKGRAADNIRRVRAVWHDDDVGWEGEFPLAPSLVVQTSPDRFHRYWLVEGDWPADEDGRSDFSAVMAGMVANHGSDPNPIDICRALRVPGFNHMKGAPHPVAMLDDNGQRYTREQIVEAFAVERRTIKTGSTQGAVDIDWVRVVDVGDRSFEKVTGA